MRVATIPRKRIQIILPFLGLTGGNMMLLELANRLKDRGHDVWMIYHQPDVPWWKPRGFSRIKLRDWGVLSWIDWYNLNVPVVRCPELSARHVPDADVILAMHWRQVPMMSRLPASKGKKIYYVTGYESDWVDEKKDCDASYRLPLRYVVMAGWLGRLLHDKFGQSPTKIAWALDLARYPELHNRQFRQPPRCLMQYHAPAVKGIADGIRAFEIAQRQVPGISLTLFGRGSREARLSYETLGIVRSEDMPAVYLGHDILIWPSHVEGYGLPCVEAMACQCAVATTDNGGSEEFAFHGETALVSPPKNPEALAANIARLATDMELRKRLATTSSQWVRKNMSWERVLAAWESVFDEPSGEALGSAGKDQFLKPV